ncbi:hypothetical protein BDA96_10G340900 [Sorghum bicolor]|uniref:Uncharacterized protein n=2 Tax=Sorghum bicolor TaxID=4558 RepID=A0A921U2D7_SORBI|nr:hypothetical protein BDA96_10G340900 [Sorghum bicolor]OQU77106.1 hypothetical protein SORBI_3010G264150 [Sorghum bicolor]
MRLRLAEVVPSMRLRLAEVVRTRAQDSSAPSSKPKPRNYGTTMSKGGGVAMEERRLNSPPDERDDRIIGRAGDYK